MLGLQDGGSLFCSASFPGWVVMDLSADAFCLLAWAARSWSYYTSGLMLQQALSHTHTAVCGLLLVQRPPVHALVHSSVCPRSQAEPIWAQGTLQ